LLACVALAPVCATAGDPVAEFEELVRVGRERTISSAPVSQNTNLGGWVKRRFEIVDGKYDVQRTDSLVSPVLGVTGFMLRAEQTPPYPTRAQAEAANAMEPGAVTVYYITLRYTYRDSRWHFKDGEYVWQSTHTRVTIQPDDLRAQPDALPLVAVRYWLP